MKKSLRASQPLSGSATLGIKARLLGAERDRVWRLRFRSELEHDFRRHVAQSSRNTRACMFLVVLGLLILTPIYGSQLIHVPPSLAQYLQPLVYGQIPIVLAGLVLIRLRPLSPYADWACLVMCLVGTASVLAQRSIAATYGYDIPLEYTAAYITLLLIILRTRFWQSLPWIILVIVALVINEWFIVNPTGDDYFRIIETLTLIVVSCIGGYSHEYYARQAWIHRSLLEHLSQRDSMTGLLNRKGLHTATQHMIAHARRELCPIAVAMIDIDYFKQYNDTYGHTAGDAVIRKIGELLRDTARRPDDFCGRYGGEEFIVAWSDGTYTDLWAQAEIIRKRTEQAAIIHEASAVAGTITISIGLYWIAPGAIPRLIGPTGHISDNTIARLFDMADRQLYRAKTHGRNQISGVSSEVEVTDKPNVVSVRVEAKK